MTSMPASDPPLESGPLKPPLKWAGGKRWLVPLLREIWAPYQLRRLVEPFCGGLAISLGLRPADALLSDINPHPINFYRWLQKGLRIRIELRNESDLYYRHRDKFNRLVTGRWLESRKAAEIFYFLNHTGYNGLCRFNKKGIFNVPFGQHRSPAYKRDLTPYKQPLSHWHFEHRDFASLEFDASDFVYADPPYDVEFRQYSAGGFDWDEQERLADVLARHRGPVVLSNQATDRIVKLYRALGFRLRYLDGPRSISRTGDRTPAREVLATRNL